MQMTEHIMLLRDANTCRTWYNTTTVEASCALSRCSKQINSLSVQSRYNAVEAWIVQRHRSHVRSKAVEHRRSVPKQRSVRRSCCGSLRGCWRRWRGRRPRLAQWGGGGGGGREGTRNTDTANCSRDSGSAATGRGSTVLAIRVWTRSTQAVEAQPVPFLLIHKILDATGQRSGDRLLDHGGLDGYVRNEFVSFCARLRLDGGDSFTGLMVREGRDEVGPVGKRGVRHPQFRRFRPKVVRATHPHLRPRQVLRCFTAHV